MYEVRRLAVKPANNRVWVIGRTYEPTEREIVRQKPVERVLSVIESEGNEAVIQLLGTGKA